MELRRHMWVYPILDYSRSVIKICEIISSAQVCQKNSKLDDRLRKIVQRVLRLFVSNRL